jgi:hypothetical protein
MALVPIPESNEEYLIVGGHMTFSFDETGAMTVVEDVPPTFVKVEK